MAEIQMPQLGETVTEGTITKWLKGVGDEIAEDEAIVEVSTDKVDSEIPSPVSGTITEITAEEGDTVDVGAVLAIVGDGAAAPATDGAQETDAADAADAADDAEEDEAPREVDESEAGVAEADGVGDGDETGGAPEANAEAEDDAAAGQADQAAAAEREAPAARAETDVTQPTPPTGGATEGMVLSPVVRRLIAENDVDASSLTGTGAGGRITRSDVLGAIEGGTAPAPAAAGSSPAGSTPEPRSAAPTRPAPTPPRVARAVAGEASTAVPFNNIRRRTGEHMVRSQDTSAHVFTVMEVDLEGVEKVRREHKERVRAEAGVSLTYLPFIARALVDAIDEFPHMNATVGDDELIVHHDVNLGIAVDLDYDGLIVPVVARAQDLRLPAIARAVAELADKARTRKLSADDISGGTVTITNPGASGTLVQLPIINQPQVMILSTEGVTRRPVVVTDASGHEAIAIRSIANLSMSWDHRAFDGAYAAAFLRRVVDILEQRDWEAEL